MKYYIKYNEDGAFWYKDEAMTILHQENGPAVICKNGDIFWYYNNKLHREDGPAVEYPDGTKSWYLNGKRHREDGPAIEYPDGEKLWYINGKLHRENGPAIIRSVGIFRYFLNDKEVTEKVEELKQIFSELNINISLIKLALS